MKKLLKTIMSLSLLSGLTFLPNQEIYANNEETDDLETSLLEAGVSKEHVDELIEKVNNGEIIDSLNPEKSPIKTTTENDGKSVITTQEFEDGSTSKITVTPRAISVPGSVTGGTKSSGSYWMAWTNAEVHAEYGLVNCYFHVDISAGGGTSTITNVYDYGITTVGGTYSGAQLKIIKANGNTSTGEKAEARLTFNVNGVSGWGQSTAKLKLFVNGNGSASATLSN